MGRRQKRILVYSRGIGLLAPAPSPPPSPLPASSPSGRVRLLLALLALLCSPLVAELLLRLDGYAPGAAREEIQVLVDRVRGEQAGAAYEVVDEKTKQLNELKQRNPRAYAAHSRILSPYYGFDATDGPAVFDRYVEQHLREDRAEIFTILICGGSVAEIFVGMAKGAADYLKERLEADPRLAGRRVQVQRLARAGYKQPQQLTKLAYMMAHGCRPDVVINLDGYNEINLSIRNAALDARIDEPSANHWKHLTSNTQAARQHQEKFASMLVARRDFLLPAEAALADRTFSAALTGRLAQIRAQRAFEEVVATEAAYSAAMAGVAEGEERRIRGPERREIVADVARLWSESSRAMHDLAVARGALYLHFLQPAVHVKGSKVLTAEERAKALGKRARDPLLTEHYNQLRAAGAGLIAEGVAFQDLSLFFADVEETVFYDQVHVGRVGNRMLAEHFAQEILARLGERPDAENRSADSGQR